MGLLMRNGIEYSGGGSDGDVNVYGAFIDTNKVLAHQVQFFTSMTYTATQDCYITFYLVGANGSDIQIKIDTKIVYEAYYNAVYGDSTALFLKKGQTISVTGASSQYESYYTVYGVTQGTNNIFTPVIYSDNERVIGVWRDNKPLYEKTVNFGAIPNSSTKEVDHNISNLGTVVGFEGMMMNTDGVTFETLPSGENSNFRIQINATKIKIITSASWLDWTNSYITLKYTKTTDVAGSGNWNTDGVPTHHYSTNEQVIGTWVDGKPLYQKTIDCGAMPNNTSKLVPHGINYDFIVNLSGMAQATDPDYNCPLPYMNCNIADCIQVNVVGSNIKITTMGDKSAYTRSYITMQYTKSS